MCLHPTDDSPAIEILETIGTLLIEAFIVTFTRQEIQQKRVISVSIGLPCQCLKCISSMICWAVIIVCKGSFFQQEYCNVTSLGNFSGGNPIHSGREYINMQILELLLFTSSLPYCEFCRECSSFLDKILVSCTFLTCTIKFQASISESTQQNILKETKKNLK